ncbi:MAG: CHASE3 domain-containing protein [Hyphomonadaceae bacterium]|nr:CHASE3 domain-containing protein [Hyphomonadaceae bacterium]
MARLIAHPATLPAAAAALVIAIITTALAFAGIYQSRLNLIAHTFEVERELARFLATTQEAELAARGYVWTSDEQFLSQFEAARTKTPRQVEGIAALTQDNPEQQETLLRLRRVVEEKNNDASAAIERRRAGQSIDEITTFVSGRSRALMLELNVLVEEMESRESKLATERNRDARATGLIFAMSGALAVLASLAVIVIWFRDRSRSMKALRSAFAEQEATVFSLRQSQDVVARESAARSAAEAQLRQVHKMEAIGQLTGGVAHDFNNMLAVIMSAITLSRKRMAKGDSNIAPMLDAAMDAANRAAKLTSRLLAFSRQQPLAPETLDANKFVANITDLLQRTLGENIEIETVLAGGLWRISADSSQLENAILNLAVNARDAMKGDGKLTLETANTSLDDDYARSHSDVVAGQYVMIAVTDTGTGMTPDVIERAFDPFFTTKPLGSGTGLGLSQVFGFVKQSGGNVKIYSEPGRGTTVKIYLPRFFGEHVEVSRPVIDMDKLRAQHSNETILVVEDEARLREVTCTGLRDLGYNVLEAPDGAEALKVLASRPEIQCLFTDIVMPGMTGRQLADAALVQKPNLKVLYTTGYTRNAVVHNGVLDPGVNFLPKPFTLDQLALKLREVLAASSVSERG